MRILSASAAIATIMLFGVQTALAQSGASAGSPEMFTSGVLWAIGIAGFLGFMLGSFPPNNEYAATSWDMTGALMWAVAAAAIVGGIAIHLTTASLVPAIYGIIGGIVLAVFRLATTRPPKVPRNADLKDGINRAEGETPKAKMKAAERMYNNASFQENGYYATRSLNDWRYKNGASADVLTMLGESFQDASHGRFEVLVVLVSELPSQPGEPCVVVVRGAANLRTCKGDADGLTLTGVSEKIPAANIRGLVGYAWR